MSLHSPMIDGTNLIDLLAHQINSHQTYPFWLGKFQPQITYKKYNIVRNVASMTHRNGRKVRMHHAELRPHGKIWED